ASGPNTTAPDVVRHVMSTQQSTATPAPVNGNGNPEKPTPYFPLFPHATRRWAKKIRGKLYYFGPWDDPQGALDNYNRQAEALHPGRAPRGGGDGGDDALTVKALGNRYLNAKLALRDNGEITNRTFEDNREAAGLLVSAFGPGRRVDDL